MTESLPNPLLDVHRQAEAEFQPYGEIEIVSTFGEPQAEYAAIRKSCGMIDLPQRGVIEVTGKDRLPFLNNLLTNQTFDKQTNTALAPGKGVYAFLLHAKTGRIIADLNVIERGNATMLELDSRLAATVVAALEKYVFAEDVKISSQVGTLHEIALHGPGAEAVLEETSLPDSDALGPHGSIGYEGTILWRNDLAGVPGYHLIISVERARKVWMELLTKCGSATDPGRRMLRPVGWAAFNATRIEAGRPLCGIDFDDSVLPHETGPLLSDAVSFTKGCYPGQEIVARMHARQQVARQLAGVRMEDDALPLAGAQVFDDQSHQVGIITSSTISPVLSNVAICLALLKRPFFNVGTILSIPAEGAMRRGTVVQTPFVAHA